MRDERARRQRLDAGQPTVEQIRAFCAVVDAGSYRAAARAMNIDPARRGPLARLVERLAATLGREALIKVDHRGEISLTTAGAELLPRAKALLAAADELMNTPAQVTLATYPAIGVRIARGAATLIESGQLHLAEVSDALRSDGGARIVRDVAAGKVDIAIAPTQHSSAWAHDVLGNWVYDWCLRAVFPEGHSLRSRTTVNPVDLRTAGLRILCSPTGHSSRALSDLIFRQAGIDPDFAGSSPDPLFLKHLAEASQAFVALIPDDSFGPTDPSLGPSLVDPSGRAAGGSYSLFVRADVGPSRSERIAELAADLAVAVREVE